MVHVLSFSEFFFIVLTIYLLKIFIINDVYLTSVLNEMGYSFDLTNVDKMKENVVIWNVCKNARNNNAPLLNSSVSKI